MLAFLAVGVRAQMDIRKLARNGQECVVSGEECAFASRPTAREKQGQCARSSTVREGEGVKG